MSAATLPHVSAAAAGASAGQTDGAAAADAARKAPFTIAGHEIEGVSVAGQETCLILPRLRVVLDTGRCPQRSVYAQHVLLTHAHMDHIGGLPFHVATRCMLRLPPTVVVLPKAILAGTERLLQAHRELDNSDYQCTLVPLQPGQEHALPNKYVIRPFPTYHPVPSQGYVLYARKSKLKPELVGMSTQQVGALRKAGQEVTDTVETPEIAFTGDTSAEFITAPGAADALRARLLIMELTFLGDEGEPGVEHARSFGHMHIDEFVAAADAFQNEAILLIHFSARYTAQSIRELLDAKLPPQLRAKCTPFLEGFR